MDQNEPKLVEPFLIDPESVPDGVFLMVTFDDECGFALSSDGVAALTTDGVSFKAVCSHGLEVVMFLHDMDLPLAPGAAAE